MNSRTINRWIAGIGCALVAYVAYRHFGVLEGVAAWFGMRALMPWEPVQSHD